MKKIYLTSLHLSHGGVEFVISKLANSLSDIGYQVVILCTYNLGEPAFPIDKKVEIRYLTHHRPNRKEFMAAFESKNIISVFIEGIKSLKILHDKKKVLKESFKQIKEGIIISSRNEDSVLLAKYGNKGVTKIAQLHHDHNFNKRLINDIKYKYTNIDYLVVLTEELRKEISSFMQGTNNKTTCVTIENFIEPRRKIEPTIEKDKTIISVGRLHSDKGFDRLIEIFAEVHSIYPEWKLKIIGDGELKETLLNQVKSLNLMENVSFMGNLSNDKVREEMEKSSLYCMTSVTEGFGIVLIEAMDSGLPIVSYDVRVGPRAIIKDGFSGYLVENNKKELYVNRLEQLIENKHLRTEMGANAIKLSKKYYKNIIIRKWQNILMELI